MKTRVNLFYLLFLGLLMTGISCSDDDNKEDPEERYEQRFNEAIKNTACVPEVVKGEVDHIVGKWLLITVSKSLNNQKMETKDVSCHSIIYEFTGDNRLILTDNDSISHFKGENVYRYRKLEIPDISEASEPGFNMEINDTIYCFSEVSPKFMGMGIGGIWGETLVRIE